MKAWADFYPLVLTSVPGCPLPVVDQKLVEAAREFCLRTDAWEEEDVVVADGSRQRFDYPIPSRAEAIKVLRASVSGVPLDIFGRAALPAEWETNGGPWKSLFHFNQDECLLFPKPSAGERVEIAISVRPRLDGAGVGDALFTEHAEHIAAGARFRLLRMPGVAWRDADEALVSRAEFEAGCHEASNRDFQRMSPSTRRVKSWG